jgi:hypothetical protein
MNYVDNDDVKKYDDYNKHHFQQYFSYVVAVSFIGVGNWSAQ